MDDDNLVQFELPERGSDTATDATDEQYLQQVLATRLDNVGALMRDLAQICAREDVHAHELALIDQVVTQLEHVLYRGQVD